MALLIGDRVKETSTTTGTGAFSLDGAETGFQTFSSVIGDGNETFYCIQHFIEDEFEVGVGTYTASSDTLSRDTIIESSNSDNAVNFSAGNKVVFVTLPSSKTVFVGGTDLAVADGGTGASTAAAARTNLDVDQAGTAVALAIALG